MTETELERQLKLSELKGEYDQMVAAYSRRQNRYIEYDDDMFASIHQTLIDTLVIARDAIRKVDAILESIEE